LSTAGEGAKVIGRGRLKGKASRKLNRRTLKLMVHLNEVVNVTWFADKFVGKVLLELDSAAEIRRRVRVSDKKGKCTVIECRLKMENA
jgi:hypothetical protein